MSDDTHYSWMLIKCYSLFAHYICDQSSFSVHTWPRKIRQLISASDGKYHWVPPEFEARILCDWSFSSVHLFLYMNIWRLLIIARMCVFNSPKSWVFYVVLLSNCVAWFFFQNGSLTQNSVIANCQQISNIKIELSSFSNCTTYLV